MNSGQTIVIKGDISGNEDLVISGRVEGSINLDGRVLTLAAGCHVVGEVAAGTVIVAGSVDGSIEAATRLEIRNTATVDGDLTTPTLVMMDGSQVSATVEMPARERKPKLAVAV
jgi:cytoskeletal protein CcmA (bactofilin family)